MAEQVSVAEKTSSPAKKPTKVGVVVKAAMEKSITVKVDRLVKHTKFEKYIKRSKKYIVHDESSDANVGDVVRIVECRPLSKTKHWRLLNIISKAK